MQVISQLNDYLFYIFPFSFKELGLVTDAPGDNEEYIFNSRPASHYRITQTQLNKWYVNLFKEAKNQGVVHGVTYDDSPDLPVNLDVKASPYTKTTSEMI